MIADARIGTQLAGYRIEAVIGRGGMSVVYLAEDIRLKRKVALKLLSLGRGASGVRWGLIELMEGMLAKRVTPVVPSQGSVGASGDLAPLAHMTAAMIGEGDVHLSGRRMPAPWPPHPDPNTVKKPAGVGSPPPDDFFLRPDSRSYFY